MIRRLPFYNIFDALRKNGFQLGISEYHDLIQVLCDFHQYQPTENIISKIELFDICKTLWLKPNQVPIIFETIFNEQYDRLFITGSNTSATLETGNTEENTNRPENTVKKPNSLPVEKADELIKAQDELRLVNDRLLDQSRGVRIVLGPSQGDQQHFKNTKAVEPDRRFLFSDNYFLVSFRDLHQLFSYLPERKQQKAENEIDIDATIHSIAMNGYLMEAVFKKEEEVLNHLVLLHDHKGSMVAFEKLSELISRAGTSLFKNVKDISTANSTYYFQNATEKYIYLNKANTTFMEIKAFKDLWREKKVIVIIVSDAGAARGSNSDIRVKLSIRMLMMLKEITNRIVWLNPMPKDRWENTSAERIANHIPMFAVDRNGLRQAADTIRGKQTKIN